MEWLSHPFYKKAQSPQGEVVGPEPRQNLRSGLTTEGFRHGSMAKNPPANPGDGDSTPGSERSPGEENGNPLQYFCLGNSTDRRPGSAKVRGVTKETDTAGGKRQNRLRL